MSNENQNTATVPVSVGTYIINDRDNGNLYYCFGIVEVNNTPSLSTTVSYVGTELHEGEDALLYVVDYKGETPDPNLGTTIHHLSLFLPQLDQAGNNLIPSSVIVYNKDNVEQKAIGKVNKTAPKVLPAFPGKSENAQTAPWPTYKPRSVVVGYPASNHTKHYLFIIANVEPTDAQNLTATMASPQINCAVGTGTENIPLNAAAMVVELSYPTTFTSIHLRDKSNGIPSEIENFHVDFILKTGDAPLGS